jgi:predicted nuclease of predicted toxin-antitoxin system
VRFLCDEGVEAQVVRELRAAGHDVSYVAEMNPGITDDEVLALAGEAGAILVTNDKDFGELVFRQRRAAPGVLLLRLAGTTSDKKAATVAAAVDQHGSELVGAFSVVERFRVRIRQSYQ